MNKHRRIIAFVMAFLLCIGAVFCTSAANKELAELSAKTGLEPVGTFRANANLTSSGEDLPSCYSSKEEGLTLEVRQQHNNTCWAFGTLSSFETLLLKNNESNVNILAPQHANYWGKVRPDGTGWQRDFENAGYAFIPLGYLTSWAGPLGEVDFPEQESTQEDYDNLTLTPKYGLTQAVYIDENTPKDTIKELILNYGSVVASFNSDFDYLTDTLSFYCGDSSIKTENLQGHCVSVVGWDDSYSKDNFSDSASGTPNNDGAWLIKNSWNTHFGDEGYQWISYEDVWVFNDIFGPSYALTGYEHLCEDVKLYQNEIDGATYECSYISDSKDATVTYMNAFDFSDEHRTLDKIVFESTALGCDYTVYYIPFDGSKPAANTEIWEELYTGIIDYSGYICVDVEDTKLPRGIGAIGVKISNANANQNSTSHIYNSIGVCEWLTTGSKMIFVPQAEYGLSYYMDMNNPDEGVNDMMYFYNEYFDDDIGGTFVIKAITRNECSAPHPTEPEETSTAVTEPETTVVTIPASTMQTDPTEVTTAPSTTVPVITTLPVPTTTVAVITTAPITSSTSPTDATEEVTTESTPATTVTIPVSTVTVPVTNLPTGTTFDIAEPFIYKLGDADLSGVINIKDATQIQKYAARLLTFTSRELMAADVNKNGDANVVDATYIQKFAANIKTDIKVGKECVFFE